MDASEFDVLYDSAGRLLSAVKQNRETAEQILKRAEIVSQRLENMPGNIENKIAQVVQNSVEQAHSVADESLRSRLSQLADSTEALTLRYENSALTVSKKIWTAVILSFVLSAAITSGGIYAFMKIKIEQLKSSEAEIASMISRVKNIEILSCNDMPCVKIDTDVQPFKGGYYVLSEE